MKVVYEDNHLIAVNKLPGEIVQGDKTCDRTLLEDVKEYLKIKYNKPGNVYLGLAHRLDRPTSGLVLLAKTQKALIRLNDMFRENKISKTYLAITDKMLDDNCGEIQSYLVKNEKENKSYVVKKDTQGAKLARLEYKLVGKNDNYFLYQISLLTGRHHQIRAQLSQFGVHIRGDLKYGAKRSNPDGSISLHSYRMLFVHPVGGKIVDIKAEPLLGGIWNSFGFFNDK